MEKYATYYLMECKYCNSIIKTDVGKDPVCKCLEEKFHKSAESAPQNFIRRADLEYQEYIKNLNEPNIL